MMPAILSGTLNSIFVSSFRICSNSSPRSANLTLIRVNISTGKRSPTC